jgi:hypothetical protein
LKCATSVGQKARQNALARINQGFLKMSTFEDDFSRFRRALLNAINRPQSTWAMQTLAVWLRDTPDETMAQFAERLSHEATSEEGRAMVMKLAAEYRRTAS